MRWGVLLAGLASAAASAHDLWIDKEPGGYVLYQGHRHSAHGGTDTVPYDPSAVQGFICVGPDGGRRQPGFARAYPARVAGECATLLAGFATGYWTKTAWETRNQPRTGIPGVLKSWRSEESLKFVGRWGAGAAAPLGVGLEITPTVDPFALAPGDKLVVLVTDGGRPLAGVPVAYAGETRGATGADGRVAIRLRRGGVQLIQASHETPLADGRADSLVRSATLQFEIPQ